MNTIIAPSSINDVDQRHRYQYKLLEEIWRDACSDAFTWETVPLEGRRELFYRSLRNRETGDAITCQGHGDRSHTFTFVGA